MSFIFQEVVRKLSPMLCKLLLQFSWVALVTHGASVDMETVKHPSYRFRYQVGNETTSDFKVHSERWNATTGITTGVYKVLQPDGCVRVVHYTADSTGFHPRVTYEGSCQPGGLISGHQEEEQQPTTEKALFTPGESDASTIDAHPTTHHTPAEPAIDHKAPMKTLDSEPQIAPEVTQHVGQEAVATSDEKLDSLAAHQTANLNHSTEDSSLDSIDGAQRETTGRVRSDSQISAPYFANVAESHDATFDRAREIANLKTHDEGTSSVYLQQQRVPEIRPGSNAPTRSGPGGDAVYRLNEQQHFITGSPTRNPYVSYGYPRSNYAYPSAHSAPPSIYRQYNHRQAHNQRPYYPYSHAYGVRAVPVAGNRRQPHGMRRLVPTTQPTTAFYSVKPMPYQLPARKLWPLRQPIRLF